MSFLFKSFTENVIGTINIKWLYKIGDCAFNFEEFENVEGSIMLNKNARTLRMIMRKTLPTKAILPIDFKAKDFDKYKSGFDISEIFTLLIREKENGFFVTSETWDDSTEEYLFWPMVHENEILFYSDGVTECVYIHVMFKA